MPLFSRIMRPISLILLFLPLLLQGGCKTLDRRGEPDLSRADLTAMLDRIDIPAAQLIVVVGEGPEKTRARLFTFEREGGVWKEHVGPLPASVGRKGFAPPGEKREGDGRTPSGLFPLEFVFGYAPSFPGKMPYRQATADDLWVDDVNSPDYNSWVRRGETPAASFETMLLPDRRYRHGIVIGYNRNPIRKGMGSAIFVHAWLEPGASTAGCVALDEDELARIIQWLDPEKKPVILMGNPSDLGAVMAGVPALQ